MNILTINLIIKAEKKTTEIYFIYYSYAYL